MKDFGSFGEFAETLAGIAVAQETLVRRTVSHCAKLVEQEAKAEIGHYQEQIGQFVGWDDLADATKADRVRQGFPEDEPLLRTGEMRDSIGTALSADGMEAQIGSDDDKAVWQELGTQHIPPRSFLGGAMARKEEKIVAALGHAVATALVGEKVLGGAIPLHVPEE